MKHRIKKRITSQRDKLGLSFETLEVRLPFSVSGPDFPLRVGPVIEPASGSIQRLHATHAQVILDSMASPSAPRPGKFFDASQATPNASPMFPNVSIQPAGEPNRGGQIEDFMSRGRRPSRLPEPEGESAFVGLPTRPSDIPAPIGQPSLQSGATSPNGASSEVAVSPDSTARQDTPPDFSNRPSQNMNPIGADPSSAFVPSVLASTSSQRPSVPDSAPGSFGSEVRASADPLQQGLFESLGNRNGSSIPNMANASQTFSNLTESLIVQVGGVPASQLQIAEQARPSATLGELNSDSRVALALGTFNSPTAVTAQAFSFEFVGNHSAESWKEVGGDSSVVDPVAMNFALNRDGERKETPTSKLGAIAIQTHRADKGTKAKLTTTQGGAIHLPSISQRLFVVSESNASARRVWGSRFDAGLHQSFEIGVSQARGLASADVAPRENVLAWVGDSRVAAASIEESSITPQATEKASTDAGTVDGYLVATLPLAILGTSYLYATSRRSQQEESEDELKDGEKRTNHSSNGLAP